MVEIGGKPLLWHILKIYSAHGINDFIVCCGYKGYIIKEYFANYFLHMSDVTFDIKNNQIKVHQQKAEPWRVTLIDTGDHTSTGGRLKRVASFLRDDDEFCFTYGDGVSDINIAAEINYHRSHGRLATIMSVQPAGRFGALDLDGDVVPGFIEKPKGDGGWINAGFFLLSPRVIDFIKDDATVWEAEPLNELAASRQLMSFQHHGFWQPMDTMRDKTQLEEMWSNGSAPWRQW
jgi:glucose-1-phosphate cytidylyltransferase